MRNASKETKIIGETGLFDRDWYLDQYPDVKSLGMDPTEHYPWVGALLHGNPSTKFCTISYYQANPDVAKAKINPLYHYIVKGNKEGRPIYPRSERRPKFVAAEKCKRNVKFHKREWDIQLEAGFLKPNSSPCTRLLNGLGADDAIYFADAVHPEYQTKRSYGWVKAGSNPAMTTTAARGRVNIHGALV